MNLFNCDLSKASLNQGTSLSIRKSAAVVPVFKKGIRSHPDLCNFRPIPLTCICVEHNVAISHISQHLEIHKVCVKNNKVSALTEAVKPNLFPLLMILLSVTTKVANLMFCCWTSVRLLTSLLILVYAYVISYITMEFMAGVPRGGQRGHLALGPRV